MLDTKEPNDNFHLLYEDVKKYVELQTEYIKVEFVAKLSILLSTLLIITLILVLVIAAMFYFFFSLAYALEPFFGSLAISFGAISCIYFVLVGIFILLRKRIVINPLVKFLSNLFLTKTNK